RGCFPRSGRRPTRAVRAARPAEPARPTSTPVSALLAVSGSSWGGTAHRWFSIGPRFLDFLDVLLGLVQSNAFRLLIQLHSLLLVSFPQGFQRIVRQLMQRGVDKVGLPQDQVQLFLQADEPCDVTFPENRRSTRTTSYQGEQDK